MFSWYEKKRERNALFPHPFSDLLFYFLFFIGLFVFMTFQVTSQNFKAKRGNESQSKSGYG